MKWSNWIYVSELWMPFNGPTWASLWLNKMFVNDTYKNERRKSTVRKIVIRFEMENEKMEPPPWLNTYNIHIHFNIDSSTKSIYHITSLHVKTVCRWNMNFAFEDSSLAFGGFLFLFFFWPLVFMSVYPWHHFKLGVKLLPCFVMINPSRLPSPNPTTTTKINNIWKATKQV